ncbi:MAG: c-type cytochrome [Planctomycetota bacterium]|nr:c-type cytochrome [Planctomycetota bacterium]
MPNRFLILVLLCGLFQSLTAQDYSQPVEATTSQTNGSGEIQKAVSKQKSVDFSKGPRPSWIWVGRGSGNESFLFKKDFQASNLKSAWLICSCDNLWTIRLNGKKVASGSEWKSPTRTEVSKYLKQGGNELLLEAGNQGGQAGLVAKLRMESGDGKVVWLTTDSSWSYAKPGKTPRWKQGVTVVGNLGDGPWGNVFQGGAQLTGSTPRDVFNVRPGFKVEKLFTVPKGELGSWVSICFDNRGRLLASDQGGKGICRITPAALDGSSETRVEKLDLKISSAQGMLYAFDSLYFSVNGGPGSGFYRARDTNGDDQFDELEKLKAFQGGGEHGPHALRLSPDGKSIYVIAGNHTNPPADLDWSRIDSNWKEDLLLPRQWDARGHARGKLAPGGWIAKTDPEGKRWELVSMGYRNPYDMDFNADGELFAYDADMEWDMGTPWYRPTRVVHATSGSEFGWRSGTGKWPTHFADSLPPVCEIGPGSPVGAAFGYGARFPARYQKALFICDWTFGTMYAIHLKPDGASYVGTKEEFVSRTPLPLTDVEIGPDGAMYFTIGGRGTQSELYRVTYRGDESTDPAKLNDEPFREERNLRRLVETSHDQGSRFDTLELLSLVSHEDRSIRYAARVGLERKPVPEWIQTAVNIKNPTGRIHAMLALARAGRPQDAQAFGQAMRSIPFAELTENQKLDYLRTLSVGFIRLGAPAGKLKQELARAIEPVFPSKSDRLNRELARVLVYLDSPQVIGKTLEFMKNPPGQSPEDLAELLARNSGYGRTIANMLSNLPEIQNIHYAFVLRNMRYGWTLEQRREYFAWLTAALKKSGGASYQGFINNIRKEAMANLSEAEKKSLASNEIAPPIESVSLPKPLGPGKKRTLDAAVSTVEQGAKQKVVFEKGVRAYAAAKCIVCHRFDGNGGATGPDLTNVAGRFSRRDLLDAIVNPDKVISDQYRAHVVQTVEGKLVTGRIVSETDDQIVVATNPEDGSQTVTIAKEDIEGQKPSPKSLMPAGLLDELNDEELSALVKYLMSRGNRDSGDFR